MSKQDGNTERKMEKYDWAVVLLEAFIENFNFVILY